MDVTQTAIAHSNIALVKYWGKRDIRLNLPEMGSISVTLSDIYTRSTVTFSDRLETDELILNRKRVQGEQLTRVSRFFDLIRKKAGITTRAEVISENNFPTGAGLASSASGFAALALAGSRATSVFLTPAQVSELARRGSGSAARSIFGGFVEMKPGVESDGSDAVAIPLADPDFWRLNWLIVITSDLKKKIGSTDGMELSRKTSPYYRAWIEATARDLDQMRQAILRKNFEKMGELMEHSCLKMHALTLSTKPALVYWNPVTLAVMHKIYQLRREGLRVYFTIDAGPQVKTVCLPEDTDLIRDALESVPGVKRIIQTSAGPAAQLIEKKQ
ncbi:MAG: diphosphomevalonate decarboxylase [Candidatus Cloacimonetes bacterium 4572_55]|nr:MAG: diphosphomevalonate decarboxylase [Candidatus Cloacimonetes bacterium 4572_55]